MIMIALYTCFWFSFIFFFNVTATTEIYTLSLHDALPIYDCRSLRSGSGHDRRFAKRCAARRQKHSRVSSRQWRSEEHTSELQSQSNLVCRLLLEKKKTTQMNNPTTYPINTLTSYSHSCFS